MSRSFLRRRQQEPARSRFDIAPIAAAVVALTMGAAHAQSAPSPTPAASAADTTTEAPALDAVTVHSRNRIERLQDVPVSVSVVTGAELERLDAYGVSAIAKRAANVSWNIGNQRTSSLSIRGIGKIGQTEAQDPSVGVIFDGVSYGYNALTSSFDFVDIDTIEVARGPQGTLQGKNASVGSITINTKRPSFTPTADYTLAFNKNNGVLGVAAIGGPVIDDLLAWRGTFSVDRQQGARANAYNRDQTYTNTDRVSGRVQFLLKPSDDFSARFEGDIQPRAGETTNGNTQFSPTPATYADGVANPLTTDAATRLGRSWFTNNPGYSLADYYGGIDNDAQHALVTGSDGLTTEVNWKIPSGQTLTSITAWKSYHFNAVNDEGTPFDIYKNAGGFLNRYKQLSQELRLSSQTGGFVDYQTGLFFFKATNTSEYRRAWGSDAGAWFATPGQYKALDVAVNPDGSVSGGRYLLTNSLNGLAMDYNAPAGLQYIRNKSYAAFAQADWHLTKRFTVTTGARATREDRETTADSLITINGDGAALNPVATPDGSVQMGGFDSFAATGALKPGANSAAQLSLADQVANRYFGVAITSVPGAAYAKLTSQQLAQVAAAKAIRLSQLGVVYGPTAAQPFKKTQPAFVVSPSYKFSDTETGYISWQYGEKAGIAQVVNGISDLVAPEKNNSYEIGLKSSLLHHTLTLNADVYLTNIKNYQQSVRVVDQYTTNLNIATGVNPAIAYTSTTGNVPKVQSKGVEVDAFYVGIPNLSLRFSGAYIDASYKSFPNSAQPLENGYPNAPPYQDVTGQALAGASRVYANLGVDYRLAVYRGYAIRVSSNTAFNSRYNSDVSLSSYAWVPSSAITDLQIGFSRLDNKFDIGVLAKNLFNDGTVLSRTWNSYTPPVQRWIGVVASGRL